MKTNNAFNKIAAAKKAKYNKVAAFANAKIDDAYKVLEADEMAILFNMKAGNTVADKIR